VELLGGMPGEGLTPNLGNTLTGNTQSRFEKVRMVIQKSFPLIWFSSRDVQSVYEQELKEPVSLSTVSTYLSRMTGKGLLLRVGENNTMKYKVAPKIPHATVKQQIK
jgi:hypothetical protein